MTDATLALPDEFEETRFERGRFGPDDREGFVATVERATTTLSVLPVRYERTDGSETVTALDGDFEFERAFAAGGDVARTTAFALRVRVRPFEKRHESLACIAADAGDALAAAVWLARASDDDAAMARHLRLHAGTQPSSRARPVLSDDDVLTALFADEPTRCVLTGKQTRSHEIRVPYRYAPLLDGIRYTDAGVVRFPTIVSGLAGAVSHAAWTDRDLDDVDFGAPLERDAPGRYSLDADAAAVLSDALAERFALRRPEDV